MQVTHNASPDTPINYCGTVLKESDDLVVLGVTFCSKMTFEKHLRPFSRAAFQRLGILRKSWRVFHDRSLLERCFPGFVLPVLEYCSAVWCSAADTHLKLLDLAVSGHIQNHLDVIAQKISKSEGILYKVSKCLPLAKKKCYTSLINHFLLYGIEVLAWQLLIQYSFPKNSCWAICNLSFNTHRNKYIKNVKILKLEDIYES